MANPSTEQIKREVRRAYGRVARQFVETKDRACCCGPASERSCCAPQEAAEAECCADTRLYAAEEIADLPESVTEASLGCGNPIGLASLQPGEVVLDLGSGGGIDCFLAAKRVGSSGKVIGLDMTPEMVQLARRNAKKMGATNVEFRYGEMEEMPLGDESVDVILSNCVINLSPDKDAVFAEAYRVLKPGGRLIVSDIVTRGELPEALRANMRAWAGCVSGALDDGAYLAKMREAGLTDVEVVAENDMQVVAASAAECGDELSPVEGTSSQDAELLQELATKIASVTVRARKPAPAPPPDN